MAIAVCLMIFLLTILLVVHVCIPAYPYNMVGLSGGHQLKGNKPDHNRFHVDLKHPNWPNDYTFGQLMPIGQSRPQKNMNNVGSVIVCNQLAQNAIIAGLDNSTRQYIPSLLNIHRYVYILYIHISKYTVLFSKKLYNINTYVLYCTIKSICVLYLYSMILAWIKNYYIYICIESTQWMVVWTYC